MAKIVNRSKSTIVKNSKTKGTVANKGQVRVDQENKKRKKERKKLLFTPTLSNTICSTKTFVPNYVDEFSRNNNNFHGGEEPRKKPNREKRLTFAKTFVTKDRFIETK